MTSLESNCAEVAWFCRQAAAQPVAGTTLYNLHRRQLLVVGYPGISQLMTDTTGTVPRYNTIPRTSLVGSNSTPLYDLSFRLVDFVTSSTFNPFPGSTLAQPNTLGDLTKREHRLLLTGSTAMRSGTFPYAFLTDATNRAFLNATFDQTDRTWEDVALTNVIAFDVRVFDPGAVAQAGTGPNLYPGDPGYSGGGATSLGGYVDLGWGTSDALLATGTFTRSPVDVGKVFPPSGMTAFQSDGMAVSGTGVTAKRLVSGTSIAAQRNALTYDTWSLHYEFNNVDDDLDGSVDEGTDGNDNNGDDVPDDPAEYETSPPYPVPLRGVEVRIRCYEPTSKQVRQITIRHTFVKK
jgi:hypothetical protein